MLVIYFALEGSYAASLTLLQVVAADIAQVRVVTVFLFNDVAIVSEHVSEHLGCQNSQRIYISLLVFKLEFIVAVI